MLEFDAGLGAKSFEDDGADDAYADDGYEVLVDESLVIGMILDAVVVVASSTISKDYYYQFLFRLIINIRFLG